ncbi:F-BOX WITH WD-40 2 [Artemisia annua]|uniref:F-BOX WITH WD-40 2 n=1 Tax=Artemisia annua TaxID=35608 RepID=A0A2U1Q1L7_ARTAN|nr:F-BOX WITH WD-40 2 [Artemisia annua]
MNHVVKRNNDFESEKYLKELRMPMSSITDQMVVTHIKPLPNLTTLDISYCFKITRKGIEAFGNQCKSLVKLRRNMPPPFDAYCPPIDDSETKAIAETMPNLTQIYLCFGQFGNIGLSEVLNKCKSLTHLDIQGSWNVESEGDIEERCKRLEHFQDPWVNYENDFCDSNDDESEEESESD